MAASTSASSPVIIDGKATALTIRSELKERVDGLREKHGKVRSGGRVRNFFPPSRKTPS